jgi:predicted dienelactone hydrolase
MKRSILVSTIILLLSVAFLSDQAKAQNIGETTFRFIDEPHNRPVVTEVWYPTSQVVTQPTNNTYPFIHIPTVRDGKITSGRFPLILISHGTGGGRMTLEWLADKLVANGFIVAAVDHYGNTYDNKIAEDFVEPWRRPLDISFALTSLLKDTTFGKHIDEKRIGAAGFSIGGYTVIALAGGRLNLTTLLAYFNTPDGKKEEAIPEFPGIDKLIKENAVAESFKSSPPLKDQRIKAFFAICPAIG